MNKQLKQLRKDSKITTPGIIIGKNGITDQTIANIKKELQKEKIVKIKILKTYIEGKDRYEVFNEISEKCNATIVHTLGFTVTLTRK